MFIIRLEDEISCDVVDYWDVYVVLLWGVCVLFGNVAHEEEEKKVLG